MSWTNSQNCFLLTCTFNFLDRFIEFFLSTTSWTSSRNCFLSTTSLHYQYLGHIHRIVFFQQLPYTVNILDTSIELFSFNIFLTLSISWTHPQNCFLSTSFLHHQYLGHIHRIVFFQQLPYTVNIFYTFIELFSFNIFLTLSISWTHPQNCFLSTASLHCQYLGHIHRIFPLNNFLDKFKELFSFNNFLTLSISWSHQQNCFLSTASIHYQYLGHIHRIVFFQQLPYTVNILDTSIELFSFNNFLTLSISWTHPQNCFLSLSILWTSSQNCFISTADPQTINVYDKIIELFHLNTFLTLLMSQVRLSKNFQRTIAIIVLSIRLNMCFGCSKECLIEMVLLSTHNIC